MSYTCSSGNYFTVPRTYSGVTALTVSAWFRPTSITDATICALWEDAGTDQQFLVSSGSDGSLIFAVFTTTARVASTATGLLTVNTWSHLALVYNGTNIRGFVDGVKRTSDVSGSGGLKTRTGPFGIGARQAGNQPSTGATGEAAVWRSALADDEIISLSKGFPAFRIRKPDVEVSLIRDVTSREGYTITTVGAPTVFPHPRTYR